MQFTDPLVLILLVSAIVTIFLDEWVDAIVIFGVVLLNAIVGYLQEAKAVAAIDALSRAMTAEATLLRAGEQVRLPATEIVPGDLVLVQAGDKVPADLRLFRTRDLRVDESALTGESVPVEKDHSIVPRDAVLAERADMAYASTLVTYGTGAGLVVATGDRTEVGKISQLIQQAHDLKTPLTRKIDQFSKILLFVIVGLAALTFVVGLVRGEDLVEMFRASIALAVAAIPEGLPAAVTVTLAIGVNRMAKRRAIIRKLPAVETLGSTMVICTDKTGTLTQNEMTVQRLVAGGAESRVSGVGYGPEGEIVPGPSAAAREMLLAGLLCNDTALNQTDGRYEVAGDPTEAALLTSAAKAGMVAADEAAALPRLDAIPFESAYQYMATLHDAGDRHRVVYLKGAVEKVLERCSAAVDAAGAPAALDAAAVHAEVDALAADGLRVLAFARGDLPDGTDDIGHDDVAGGLTFLGLQAMMDPPRPAAIAAVEACHHAGISVKMITGDHAATAAAIAHEIGIAGAGDGAVTGAEMAAVHDAEFIELADRTNVFARVTPEQKLRLVEALQSKGQVVAMTGDGVNDAPGAQAGRHRRRHGHHRHRRGQGRRGHGAHRRRLRLHRGRRRGGPRRLRQPRQVHRLRASDQRRPGARHPHRGHARHGAAHRAAADPLDQHDHRGAPRPGSRLRAQGAGDHGPAAARAGVSDRLARRAHPHRRRRPHPAGVGLRRLRVGAGQRPGGGGRPHVRRQRLHVGADLLSVRLPLAAPLAVHLQSVRQPDHHPRRRRGRPAAGAVHLHARS